VNNFTLFFVAGFMLNSCSGEFDHLPLEEYENVELHCYFYFPNDKEKYLGQMTGISNCQSAAYHYASQKNLSESDKWDYIACTIRKDSDCYETIK
jgi:hypothetical protein